MLQKIAFPTPVLLGAVGSRGIFTSTGGAKQPTIKLPIPATDRRRWAKKVGLEKNLRCSKLQPKPEPLPCRC
jgi:hypothetical protein